jgi:hypothetical protein
MCQSNQLVEPFNRKSSKGKHITNVAKLLATIKLQEP